MGRNLAVADFSENNTTHTRLSELEKGQLHFDRILGAIADVTPINTAMCAETVCDQSQSSCLELSNGRGERAFLRFDYFQKGSWGNQPEFRIGVYATANATCALRGLDGQLMLMNTNRGENGFEKRFQDFISVFGGNNSATPATDCNHKKLTL